LDTDGDGELSAAEIANASVSLKKLDKNGKPCVSLQIDTWKPQERQDAPVQQKDPWDQ